MLTRTIVKKAPAPPFIELCARNARETWARKRDALRAKAGVVTGTITGRVSYTRAPFEERER